MKSGKNLLLLSLLCISFTVADAAWAQRTPQPFPRPGAVDPPQDWRQWIFRNNTFRVGGVEAGVSTYNYYIGLPVFWFQNQVKLVPQMSLFWKQPESWRHTQAYGGRALYFLNDQKILNTGDLNPYTGGFTVIAGSDHNTGIVIGIEPFISSYFKIGVEMHAGLRSHYGEDKAFAGVGIVMGLGW